MRERPKFDGRTLKRLLSYMRAYKGTLVLVTVCILLSAVAGAASSMFLQKLIDGYIVPMLGTASPDYSGLIRALITIGCVYLVGTLATWLYNRRMVTIAQGTLKRIRDEMFEKMQRLPIRYFDTHTHGDIMSLYTNDTDTLRQMIAQSMSQLVSSVFTLTVVFFCMLYISIWLTLIVCAVMALILVFVRRLTGRIGGYFMAQQTALADLNGYVEEMVNGQKVVKVFCHEEQSKAELRRRNRVWAENAARASGMANSMMPMMNAVGYLQYVIIAVVGGTMAIARHAEPRPDGHEHAHARYDRILPHALARVYKPDLADLQPVQLHRHGAGRRIAYLRVHGCRAGDGRRLCDACQRHGGKRHARRDRPPHGSLGVEAPARRRHGHIHEACRARRVRSRGLRLYAG